MVLLVALLALLARMTEKVLVFTHDMYCPKSALRNESTATEDLQDAKALESLTGPEIRDGDLLTLITPCLVFSLKTPESQPPFERRPIGFTITP